MKGFDKTTYLLGKAHAFENPKKVFARQTGECSRDIECENAGVRKGMHNKLDDFCFESEDQVDHLFAFNSTTL